MNIDTYKIIFVDDDIHYSDLLIRTLNKNLPEKIEIRSFHLTKEALEFIKGNPRSISVVVVDYRMPEMGGLEFIRRIQNYESHFQILVLTGSVDANLASLIPNFNIFDLLEKDISPKKIIPKILMAHEFYLHLINKENKIQDLSNRLYIDPNPKKILESNFHGIIGNSPQIQKLKHQIIKVALSDVTCLILGESGTGKEMVARAIHEESKRKNKIYNIINCAAIPAELLESELFGYKKGTFTGANSDRIGILEASSGGTIFLDEVTELPFTMQAKLLRFLQEGTIQTLGSQSEKKIDVRVIAASNRNIRQAINEKTFREDLYYRLGVIELELPLLNERKEDIPLLFEYFIQGFLAKENKTFKKISDKLIKLLLNYPWSGNIRELRNAAHRLVLLMEDGFIDENNLPREILEWGHKNEKQPIILEKQNLETTSQSLSIRDLEKASIEKALLESNGNRDRASKLLGISRATIFRKIKEYGI
jgi:DNA-binding NtrC family response regulator